MSANPNVRTQILAEAYEQIDRDKEVKYGDPDVTFRRIAIGWSMITGTSVSAEQVALMMVWLKVERAAHGSGDHRDSFIDMAGYAALGGEIHHRRTTVSTKENPHHEHPHPFIGKV